MPFLPRHMGPARYRQTHAKATPRGVGFGATRRTVRPMTNDVPLRTTNGAIVFDARRQLDEQLQRAHELRANPLLLAEGEDALRAIERRRDY